MEWAVIITVFILQTKHAYTFEIARYPAQDECVRQAQIEQASLPTEDQKFIKVECAAKADDI